MRRVDELERLFREIYAPTVRALGVAFGDTEAAADAVQDAFVQAHRQWRRIQMYDRPDLWVRRVAVNRLLNQRRGRKRRGAATARLDSEPSASIDESAAVVERLALAAALAQLAPRQRVAVTLHHLAGLPIAAIADVMGVAEGTVKSQLHDARGRLRAVLETGEVPQ